MKTFARMAVAVAATVGVATTAWSEDGCRYDGVAYSDGATVCQSGTQFRCADGGWESLAVACPVKNSAAKECEFGGKSYSSGAASCQSGSQYRCDAGSWMNLGIACAPDQIAAPRVAPPSSLRNCMLDGSTVSHSSTVCKTGVMYACDDGDWRNLGTPCK